MKLYTIKFCMHFAMISFNFYFACLKCGCLVVGIFQLSLFYYKLRYLTRSDAAHSPTHLIFFFLIRFLALFLLFHSTDGLRVFPGGRQCFSSVSRFCCFVDADSVNFCKVTTLLHSDEVNSLS